MHRCIFVFLLVHAFYGISPAQSVKHKEYLVKLPETFYKTYSSLAISQKSNFLKDYFETNDSFTFYPVFRKDRRSLSLWSVFRLNEVINLKFSDLKTQGKLLDFQINQPLKIHSIPNDSLYHKQWYLKKIQADKSQNFFQPIERIILAVIDTGIDYTHPDLDGSLWINRPEDLNGNGILDSTDINNTDDDGNGYVDDVIGWDFTDAPRFPDGGDYIDPDNNPMDEYQSGHGTQIAGIIAAQADNEIGIAGIVPSLELMNLRAGTASGYLEEDDVAEAIMYAIDNGARVINMSFGDIVVSPFMEDVISYAHSFGIVLVASAGNSGTNEKHYPSGFPGTISVSATDSLDNIAGFSSWGQTIDVSAPGENILSCKIGGGYNYSNGTSFSAPIISAAAGFILANHPEFDNEHVRNILKSSANDLGTTGWDVYYGSGRLNLFNASQINNKSKLFINEPEMDSYVSSDSIPIIVTIQDIDLKQASLWYGVGENPQEWQQIIGGIEHQVISDTITMLDISSYIEESIVLRLNVQTWQNELKEYRSLFYVDKTKPVFSSLDKVSVLDENRYAVIISFETDDVTTGEIYFRPKFSNQPFTAKSLQYKTQHHKIKIGSNEISGHVEFYIRIVNPAGLENQSIGSSEYEFYLTSQIIPSLPFHQVNWSFPKGYVLPKVTDFDNDGNDEVVLSLYDENNSFGNVAIYEFNTSEFIKLYETPFSAIPRDWGDADSDGKSELLIGYGKKSYLLEANMIDEIPQNIVWKDTVNFWASGISDLDSDGLNEIIGRFDNKYKLLENTNDNTFIEKFSFVNYSAGDNALGPPTTIVSKIDYDSFFEFIFGDYDGDLLIFENNSDDSFTERYRVNLPLTDATDFMTAGRFMNPQQNSLIVGTHTDNSINYEHEFDSRYWSYSHIFAENDNSYVINQRINIFGYSDIRDFDSGVSTGQLLDGSLDYLFICAHPDLYIFQSNGDSLVPVWYVNGVQSNKVLLHDFDKNGIKEIYYNNGESFVGYELGESNQPIAPQDFSAFPLDTTTIRLQWQMIPGAQRYIIHRGFSKNDLIIYDSTQSAFSYIDTAVINNQKYAYAIQSYDNAFQNPYSNFSEIQTARPNDPPRVDTLININQHQVQIYFNEQMLKSSLSTNNFLLFPQQKYASSAIGAQNGNSVLISFSDCFRKDTINTILLSNLRDMDKTPLDSADQRLHFLYLKKDNFPYILEWKLENRYQLKITFNMPMKIETVLNLDNYKINPSGKVTKIEQLDNYGMSFRLEISKDSFLGSTGVVSYISFSNIESSGGVLFSEGNTFSITSAKMNLKELIVYPQPVRQDVNEVIFANITEDTEISIFDIQGHLIIRLKENDKNGGIPWNLRNENGEKVSSGIYIYYAKNNNEVKSGKIAIVR